MIVSIFVISIICLICVVAYAAKMLSVSGAVAAVIVGVCIFWGLDLSGLILLGSFFGTSSLLSIYKSKSKAALEEKLEKGSRRDWLQVIANGGIGALASLLYYSTNDPIWVLAFLTSIASATGDTWSSEIGPLSKSRPILVRSLKRVEPGTSGAISLLGTIGALAGILFIVICGYIFMSITIEMALIILFFGIVGNAIDTLLGAFLQRTYCCEICSIETEKRIHCEMKTKKVRGLSFLNNDGVNLLSSLLAPLFSLLTYPLIL